MFSYIKGELTELEPSRATVEACGVGYSLTISGTTHASLVSLTGNEMATVKLYTNLAVREDGVELFGFYTKEELNFFSLLTGVSGVGPKAAISILSSFTAADLVSAIVSDRPKTIATAQGIGVKTASRIILELKDKLRNVSLPQSSAPVAPAAAASGSALADAESALTILGYREAEIREALRDVNTAGMSTEEIIRICLSKFVK